MTNYTMQIAVRLNPRLLAIISSAIEMDLAENYAQVVRKAIREFAVNHNIEVEL